MNNKIDKQIHANELKLRILMTNVCNNSCSFCLNDFQLKPNKIGEMFVNEKVAKNAIENYVEYFKGKYPLQVYFSGGEPTLHRNLIDLMKYSKFLNCRVTLNTNGKFPKKLEKDIINFSDTIHFGTYEKNKKHAEKIKKAGGLIQGIYPYADESFIEFYSKYNIPIKIFRDFYREDLSKEYIDFANKIEEKFPDKKVSFRYTGIQENRGPGCNGCDKTCITLKASWLFPEGGSSPCPQSDKSLIYHPKTKKEWKNYFEFVENFHKINIY